MQITFFLGSEALSMYSKLFHENLDKLIKDNASERDQLANDLTKIKMERDSQSIQDLLADLAMKDDEIPIAHKEDQIETDKVARSTSKLIPPERLRKQNLESQKIASNRTHGSSSAKVTSESRAKTSLFSGSVTMKKQGIGRVGSAPSKEKSSLRNDDRTSESNTVNSKGKISSKKQK